MIPLNEIFQVILILELPATFLGSYVLFKKIKGNKEILEWVGILREFRDVAKELLAEYKKTNGENVNDVRD